MILGGPTSDKSDCEIPACSAGFVSDGGIDTASARPPVCNGLVRILDGGSGYEAINLCEDRWHLSKNVCWSALLLHKDQTMVRHIYRRFLDAGAEVITSLSYQADPSTLSASCGVSIEQAEQLMRDSVLLAKHEVALRPHSEESATSPKILVAASLGPYGALLADGSEYTGAYLDHTPLSLIRASYERRVAILTEAQPDLLAFETIPSVAELRIVLDIMRDRPDISAWVSMSCPDGSRTARGDSFDEAVNCVNQFATKNIVAFGVNCVVPLFEVKTVVRQIRLRLVPWIQVIVYPNNGQHRNPVDGSWYFLDGIDEETFYQELPTWIDEGALWIGGCCLMGSSRMTRVTEIVRSYRARQVAGM